MNFDYRVWIKSARDRLAALEQQRQAIDMEIAALEQSIRAFEPLVNGPALGTPNESTAWGLPGTYSDIGLTNSIRVAIKASTGPLEPTEVRDTILHKGFDLSGRSNAMANIHQVLRRLVAQREVREVTRGDGKTRYEWIEEPPHKDSPLKKSGRYRMGMNALDKMASMQDEQGKK